MQTDTELLVLGRITSTFGIKGWVKVYSHTHPKENIFSYRPWLLKQNNRLVELKFVEGRVHGKGLIAKLEGIDNPESAAIYLGQNIYLSQDTLPELEEGNYYLSQLIGLEVINLQGDVFGRVANFIETGANDVLVVKPSSTSMDKQERLIPLVMPQIVTDVDLASGRLTVDWYADY